jgi:hypothetical protein
VTAFVDRTLTLRRADKIRALNDLLTIGLGEEGIGSLNAIRDPEEQMRAVELIGISLNGYLEEDEKADAREELGRLLN